MQLTPLMCTLYDLFFVAEMTMYYLHLFSLSWNDYPASDE